MTIRFAMTLLAAGLVGACATGTTNQAPDDSGSVVTTTTTPTETTAAATTTGANTTLATPTTTAASVTTAATAGFGDVPEVCLEAIQAFFVAIQGEWADYDFENATYVDYAETQNATIPAQMSLSEAMQNPVCAESAALLSPDGYPALLSWAETEAPGAVGYLEMSRAASDLSTGTTCRDNIDDFQVYVDRGGTVADVSAAERWHVFGMAAFIDIWCPLQVGPAFLSQPEVEAFLEYAIYP